MKIAIIDTGVDRFHSRLNNCFIDGATLYEDKDGNIELVENEFDDNDGHGTGIASIIHKHIPEAALYVVKIDSFHENKSENLLIGAISHIIEYYPVDIINISMGINSDTISNELEKVCQAAFQKNIFICASSFYFAEKPCYPAHFNTVIGVGTGIIKDKTQFRYLKNNPTNILAKGGLQRVANKNNSFKFGSGTSLATAHFTGILANTLKNNKLKKLKDCFDWLEENSDNSILSFNRKNSDSEREVYPASHHFIKEQTINDILQAYKLPSDVKNIALFPFEEKEMRSIVEFSDMLNCNISLIIGYPRAIKMNHVFSTLKNIDIPFTNKHLTSDELDSFDTLVVGYFLEQLLDHNLIFSYSLIKFCVERNKNFIIWDETVYRFLKKMIETNYPDYQGRLLFNNIDKPLVRKLFSLAPLQEYYSPTICVIGTGSVQGKFTVQMTLKRLLEKLEYKVSFISTEPQGILFNSDFIFPFGYNPPIDINIGEWSKILQITFQAIQKAKNPEIFITGIQGGVIPKYSVNIGIEGSQLKQLAFILGVYPDAIICTISPHDEIDFIKKTISVTNSYVSGQLIFYSLSPYTYKSKDNILDRSLMYRLSDEEYEKCRIRMENELGKPVLNIKDENNYSLVLELIQNNFSNATAN